jgi:hypothetical protein
MYKLKIYLSARFFKTCAGRKVLAIPPVIQKNNPPNKKNHKGGALILISPGLDQAPPFPFFRNPQHGLK